MIISINKLIKKLFIFEGILITFCYNYFEFIFDRDFI